MAWWLWAIVTVVVVGGSGMFAMLSLSATTAYGSHYHSLSPRQRWMGRLLYRGALLAAIACAGLGLVSAVMTLWRLLA